MINLLGSHLIELYDIGIIIFGLIIGFSFILKLHCFKEFQKGWQRGRGILKISFKNPPTAGLLRNGAYPGGTFGGTQRPFGVKNAGFSASKRGKINFLPCPNEKIQFRSNYILSPQIEIGLL